MSRLARRGEPGSPRKPRKTFARFLGLAIAAVALIFASAEVFLRLRHRGRSEFFANYDRYLLATWGPAFRVERSRGGEFLVQSSRHPDAPRESQRFGLRKPAGARRIIVLGESSAILLAEILQHALSPASSSYEFLDAAMGGSSIEQLELRANEALSYGPDALVVLFGNNLTYRHPFLATGSPSSIPFRLRALLWESRLLCAIRDAWRPFYPLQDPQAGLAPEILYRRRLLQYKSFLRRLSAKCRARGVRLGVCTVPSNLLYPPAVRGRLEEYYSPAYWRSRFEAWMGRRKRAVRGLAKLMAQRPSALWAFDLGLQLYFQGLYKESRRWLIWARDHDPEGTRSTSALNAMIRRTAVSDRFALFDIEKALLEHAPHGIPGWEVFLDNQHVGLPRFRLLEGQSCLRAMRRLWWPNLPFFLRTPAAPGGNPASPEKLPPPFEGYLESALGMTDLSDPSQRRGITYMALSHLPSLLHDGLRATEGFSDRSRRSLVDSLLAEAFRLAGDKQNSRRANDKALALDPGLGLAYRRQAEFDIRDGRFAQARQELLQASRAPRPDPAAGPLLEILSR